MNQERTILMLRHGMTYGNKLRQYIGRTDEPLCEEGIAALKQLHYPKAKKVYISSMLRCRQTAEILFPGAELISYDNLREMDFGIFEGQNFIDLSTNEDYRFWVESNCETPIPGGETKNEFMIRCRTAFAEIVNSDNSEHLVFVVHGGTLMSILSKYAKPEREYYKWSTGNGHGYLLQLKPENYDLLLLKEY